MHKLDKALTGLVAGSPFFASLLLKLERETGDCHGLRVDGKTLTINEDWLETQRGAQIKGALAAAALRCGLKHHLRREDRDAGLWNEASAIVANNIVDAAKMELPDGEPLRPDLDGMSIEQVYSQLMRERPEPDPQGGDQQPDGQNGDDDGQQGQPGASGSDDDTDPQGQEAGAGGDQGPPSCTEIEDGAGDDAEQADQEAQWEIAMLQAAEAAEARGDMPGGLEEIIEDLRSPDLDIRTLLFRFFNERARTSYNWGRPNRALMPRGIRMPSMSEPSLGAVAIFLDTSASMSQDALATLGGVMSDIFKALKPSAVIVIHCDSDIQKVERWTPETLGDFELVATGRGGTDLRPPFDWIEDNDEHPAVALYMTDLDGPAPDIEPDYPVIWTTYGTDADGPFGETVRVDT